MKKFNTSFFLKRIISLFLFMGITATNSAESYNKGWAVATVIGSLPDSASLKYYFEPQIRLIDDAYFFNQLLLLGGLGYQFRPNMMFFIGPGWIVTKTPEKETIHEKRLWQQLNWLMVNTSWVNINSRTRLEERKNTDASLLAVRLRERMWIRLPFKYGSEYSLSGFDEVFFNLNHPQWVSSHLLEQNRAFIGIAKRLTQSTVVDIGYLNQHLRSVINKTDHVLLLNFTVTT